MMNGPGPQTRVFISYSRTDAAFADRLGNALETQGFEPFIDRNEIYAFEDWWQRIQSLIEKADAVIFVLSPEAVASLVCNKEVAYAASLNKRLAPIVLRRVDANVPDVLARLNFIFFDDEARFDASLERLSEALTTDIGWVRSHTEYGHLALAWSAAGRPAGSFLRSPSLEDAERWIALRPQGAPPPTPLTQEFIAGSRRATTRRRNVLISALASGLFIALGLAGLAFWQRTVATEQRNLAIKSEQAAREQRDAALKTQSLFLGDLAEQRTRSGDSISAALIAAEGLPGDGGIATRPYVPETERSLWSALLSAHEVSIVHAASNGGPVLVVQAGVNRSGTRLVTLDSWRTLRIYDATNLSLIKAEPDAAELFLVSGDGRRLLAVSPGTKMTLWDLDDTKPVRELATSFTGDAIGARGPETQIALSERGDKIAYSLAANRSASTIGVELIDADNGAVVSTALLNGERIVNLEFVAGNARALVEDSAHNVIVHDIATAAKLLTLTGHTDIINSASYSPDGRLIVTASGHHDFSIVKDGSARLWDASTGEMLKVLTSTLRGAVSSAKFSPEGEYLVTQAQDTLLWNVSKRELIARLYQPGHSPSGLFFAPKGDALATVATDGTVVVWSTRSGGAMQTYRHLATASGAAFLPGGARIMTWAEDMTLRIWSTEQRAAVTGTLRASARAPAGDFYGLEAATGGTTVLILPERQDRDIEVGQPDLASDVFRSGAQTLKLSNARFAGSPALSPDGKRVLLRDDDGIKVVDTESGRLLQRLDADGGTLVGAAFGSAGSIGLIIKAKEALVVTRTTVPDARVDLKDAPTDVTSVRFSSNLNRVAVRSSTRLDVYDAEAGFLLFSMPAGDVPLSNFNLSANGDRLIVVNRPPGKWGGTARLLSVPEGRTLRTVEDDLIDAAISPDGRRMAVTFSNRETRLFDVASGVVLHTFKQSAIEPASGVAISRDGSAIVLGSASGRIERWPFWVDATAAIHNLRQATPRCLTAEQRKQAFFPEELPGWCKSGRKWPLD